MSILEMTAYYKKLGLTLSDALDKLYEKYGYECVSVKMTVADSTFNADEGEFKKKTYNLSWYVNSDAVVSAPNGKTDYIKLQSVKSDYLS